MVWNSSADASSVFGGKNSKLMVVGCWRKMSWMCMGVPGRRLPSGYGSGRPIGGAQEIGTFWLHSLTRAASIKQSNTVLILYHTERRPLCDQPEAGADLR